MAYQEPFDPDAYLARISQGRVDTTEFDPDAYLARLNQTKLTPLADVESLLGSTIEPPRGQAIQDLLTLVAITPGQVVQHTIPELEGPVRGRVEVL